jgi:hypothetical protein
MSEAKANVARERTLAGLGGGLLVVALVAAYANHFHNSFHFDDAHTIENNSGRTRHRCYRCQWATANKTRYSFGFALCQSVLCS